MPLFALLAALGTPVLPHLRAADSIPVVWVLDAWARTARPFLADRLGLRYVGARWVVDSSWDHEGNVAALAYDAEPVLRAALAFADTRSQSQLLDEVAGIYLAALGRFRTLGDLRAADALVGVLEPLKGPDSVRTLPWVRAATPSVPAHSTESLLCTTQFLHPAARLIHLVAALPPPSRTDNERKFVAAYLPLILHDELLRTGYDMEFYPGNSLGRQEGMVAVWNATARLPQSIRQRYPLDVRDVHLWIVGAAAEILVANRLDGELVPLPPPDRDRLNALVTSGTRRLLQSRTLHRGVPTGGGASVTTAGYFEGDFSRFPDDAYAGDSSKTLPPIHDTASVDTVSWDISHLTRLPVVLRSLWDARAETGEAYPAVQDLRQVAQQLEFRVFNGNLQQPLFRNFFDGTDGWYRVGYSGRHDWGIPPSRDCDSRIGNRQCLSLWALPAWGLIAFADTGLSVLKGAMLDLIDTADPARVAFRARYYTALGRPLVVHPADGKEPSLLLFELAATFPPDVP